LHRSGHFAVMAECPASPVCSFQELTVKCPAGHKEVGGKCVFCLLTPNLVYNEASSSCKRKPELHLRTESQFLSVGIPVQKVRGNEFVRYRFHFGLDGHFNVTWSVNCPGAETLQCRLAPTVSRAASSVSSTVPASSADLRATIDVDVNTSGLYDQSVERGPEGQLSVSVCSQGNATPEPLRNELNMLLTLEVSAQFTLELEQVEVSSAGFTRRVVGGRNSGSVVSQLDDDIIVRVTTSDRRTPDLHPRCSPEHTTRRTGHLGQIGMVASAAAIDSSAGGA
jgi:hypothetical protein